MKIAAMPCSLFSWLFFLMFLQPLPALCFGDLLFKPYAANPYEGRVGVMGQLEVKKLRLDIGNSIDLMRFAQDSIVFSIGADFFTFSRLRSEGNLKFPVETADYYFGLNAAVVFPKQFDWTPSARLRYAHISSHLIDGLADSVGHFNGNLPFVYSREFIDATFALEKNGLRFYCGLNYVYARLPRSASPIIPQLGFDMRYPISKIFEFQGGLDEKIAGVDGIFLPMHAAQVGVLLKTSPQRGISANLYYFSGRSIHGMFFLERDEYVAAGFQIQF